MLGMFADCYNLETIFVSDKWDISNVKYYDYEAYEG